jgi:hypothetical protein
LRPVPTGLQGNRAPKTCPRPTCGNGIIRRAPNCATCPPAWQSYGHLAAAAPRMERSSGAALGRLRAAPEPCSRLILGRRPQRAAAVTTAPDLPRPSEPIDARRAPILRVLGRVAPRLGAILRRSPIQCAQTRNRPFGLARSSPRRAEVDPGQAVSASFRLGAGLVHHPHHRPATASVP